MQRLADDLRATYRGVRHKCAVTWSQPIASGQAGVMMNAKRVVIPVLMLIVCAAVLVTYNVAAVNRTSPTTTPTQTPRPLPTPTPQSGSASTPWPSEEPGSLIPAAGEPAPDFTLPSVSGDAVTLSDYRGQKNVVLLFYRTGG